MKKLFIISFPVLLAACNSADTSNAGNNIQETEKAGQKTPLVQNDHNWLGLKGKVKKMTKTAYYDIYEKFDDWFPKDSLQSRTTISEFNSAGFITKTELITTNNKFKTTQHISYKNGKASVIRTFNDDKLVDSISVTWPNDTTSMQTSYNTEEKSEQEVRSKYDRNARLIQYEEVVTGKEGKITGHTINHYYYNNDKTTEFKIAITDKLKNTTDSMDYKVLATDNIGNPTKKLVTKLPGRPYLIFTYSYEYE